MELKTRYQYTYFIYPYVVEEKDYNKYLLRLLKDKNCTMKKFDIAKDMSIYQNFLPNIREFMFWSLDIEKDGIRDFEKLDSTVKSALLAEHECNMFNYDLPEGLQGKVETNNGIFFEISQIKIICFKTGVCFLLFKTNLENTNNFSDVLNFNYKFREVNSIAYNLKEYENIKIQSSMFKDVKDISALIKEITGNDSISKKANVGNDKFFVYSYSCVDQKDWNENTNEEDLNGLFEKYRSALPAGSQIINDEYSIVEKENRRLIYKNQYLKYGFTATNTVLFTSNINTANFTLVPQKYESEYLYTYLLTLYKKIFLNKLNYDFRKDFKKAEKGLLDFTKKVWIQDITNEEFGRVMENCWIENLDINTMYLKIKSEYDITYKKYNVEQLNKNNIITLAIVVAILIINIATIFIATMN